MFSIKTSTNAHILTQVSHSSVSIKFKADAIDCYIELCYCLDFQTTGEEYVFLPACCYNGNRFNCLNKDYPPLFTPEEASIDMSVTITDVPRLNKDGSGLIEVTTGDVSVPCVGIFSENEQQGVLLYTIQEIGVINLGLSYQKGKIGVTYPHIRKDKMYRWPFMRPSTDKGMSFRKGDMINIPYKLLNFKCKNIEEFYRVFFENRKCMGMDCNLPEILTFEEQFQIQKNKFNAMNWRQEGKFYGVTTIQNGGLAWQPGWVGGAMATYPLMKLGGSLEWERSIDTLRHLFKTQAPSGFFHESTDEYGNIGGVGFPGYGGSAKNWHLIRKSADVLYFLFKHFNLMKQKEYDIPQKFINGAKKLADAFVALWDKYGQFGQFIDLLMGDIIAGGSTNGAIAPAGLVKAYDFYKNSRYLEVAKESAELFYVRDLLSGYTTGGPEEILQCPDSESAFGLLESFINLYETTKEAKWLKYSEYTAHLCGSWVVSYNYKFPPGSEFSRLDMKTTGSVFANVQNKHSAPGICTLSGDSLYKLYKWTGNMLYLELFKEITLSISQYMSTEERPIYSWDVPKDASLMNDDSIVVTKEKLPQGYICERVNMSDWESERCIGGVFNGSCWSEVSNLLVLAEVSDITKHN